MTRKKLLLVLAGVFLLVLGGTAAYAVTQFTDIAGTTHEPGIIWAAENGITQGYADGTYRPNNPVTRGQMATFLNRFNDKIVEPGDANGGTGNLSGCVDCHDDGALLTSKKFQWSKSVHGIGFTVFDHWPEGIVPAGCAGCHSGTAFSAMVAAGLNPGSVTEDDELPTPQDCRACHQIHVTGTGADWALETTAPVDYYAIAGNTTFNRGAGNLCANCHQPRSDFPAADANGMVQVTSSRFGPHHSDQSTMLQGVAGALVEDNATGHYNLITNGCVTCHLGDTDNHLFAPLTAACTPCHGEVDTFNIGDTQTEVQALADQLKTLLVNAGMLNATTDAAIPGTYTEAAAAALWNYRSVIVEDRSLGVHNPTYAKAMLNQGIAALD